MLYDWVEWLRAQDAFGVEPCRHEGRDTLGISSAASGASDPANQSTALEGGRNAAADAQGNTPQPSTSDAFVHGSPFIEKKSTFQVSCYLPSLHLYRLQSF